MRAGARLGVTLKTEGRHIGTRHALQAAIEQRHVRGTHIRWQRRRIHREAMVLTGDHHALAIQVLYWMVRTVMAEFHFDGFGTGSQRQQLVPQANPIHRNAASQEFTNRIDSVIARLWIARTIRQENSIGFERQHLLCRGLCRQYGDFATALHQHAQNIALHTVIERHHVIFR